MPEMLDIYDENRTLIGVKDREDVHRDGDWHGTFHCWIIQRGADGVDTVVMQKRAPTKQFSPNKLDITAAGHYEAGETIVDGIREIREELVIEVDFSHLIRVGVRVSAAQQNGLLDYEFNDVFFLIYDGGLDTFCIQEDEVSGLVQFAIADGLALFAGERESITAQALGLGVEQVEIRVEDFIDTLDSYTYRALVLAQRCLNGEKYLVI
ncbi:MAG: NUDIX hydrolase [Anaerolineae bacterium]|nr:NUDIX hydrolase [Anaerolineae bacterium]